MDASASSPGKDNTTSSADAKYDEIKKTIEEFVDDYMKDKEYKHAEAPGWTKSINKGCLSKLQAKQGQNGEGGSKLTEKNNYKYIVTCTIMQKTGAGFYAGSAAFWDEKHDGTVSHRYENGTLYAIVNVFYVAI